MAKKVFRRIDEAINWLAGDACRLRDEGRIILIETMHGVLRDSSIREVNTQQGTCIVQCDDGTTETLDVKELLSVTETESFLMTPERAYREMRALEEAHRIPKN